MTRYEELFPPLESRGKKASRASLKTRFAAPGSTNSERLTARPTREGFVIICACTEPIGTGVGAVCVERGRPKWPFTMLTDTNKHAEKIKRHLTRLA